MKTDGHDKLEDALKGLRRTRRATPPPGLLGKIEASLGPQKVKIIPLREWRMYATAACLLLALNVTALSFYLNHTSGLTAQYQATDGTLISDFQLYE